MLSSLQLFEHTRKRLTTYQLHHSPATGTPPLQPQIHLASWPAAENQSEQDQKAPLDKALYAFATRAVAIMHEQGGPDILPKIFTELAKPPRKKASMKTVGKIYQHLTGHTLDEVLHEAETRAIPRPATPAKT